MAFLLSCFAFAADTTIPNLLSISHRFHTAIPAYFNAPSRAGRGQSLQKSPAESGGARRGGSEGVFEAFTQLTCMKRERLVSDVAHIRR